MIKTDKQKYLDRIEWMSEGEKTLEYTNYVMDRLNNTLTYTKNVEWLKDILKYKMRNGIYKAVVKEKTKEWVLVSVGRAKIEWESWKNKDMTLDYFISNDDIDESYKMWDKLYINLNLDKSGKKNKLTVNEFRLNSWDVCSVKITNVSKKWAFVSVWKYEWFITNRELNQFTDGKRQIKKWNKVLMKIKKIKNNTKNKNKQWIVWNIVKPSSSKNNSSVIKMDFVNNENEDLGLVA